MTMKKKRVLIICTGNSARSQMAEGLLRNDAGDRFNVESAGTKSSSVRPEAIAVMREVGIDISGHRSKNVDQFQGQQFDYLITVCDNARETCPVFFGATGDSGGQPVKAHWGYPDPSHAEGGDEGKRRAFELTRQAIGYRMLQLLALPLQTMDRAALQAALAEIGRS